MIPGLDLCHSDPPQHLISAGWVLDDLDRDLSDLSDLSDVWNFQPFNRTNSQLFSVFVSNLYKH